MLQNNSWAEGNNSAIASYLQVMHEIHVLLVDHDAEGLDIVNMLEMCQYRVTRVELASVAISMLSSGESKFDFVMANIHSPDLHGFKLLQQAVNMNLPIILMSVEADLFTAMRAMENGAFLYMKKPVEMDMLKYLWQYLVYEKMRPMVKLENPNVDINGERNNNMVAMDIKGKFKNNISESNGFDENKEEHGLGNRNVMIAGNKIKRKTCSKWTRELHNKFMAAVEQLGEGRCFPRTIVEIMNVPGLTKMQVASHLQKCRNDNRKLLKKQKALQLVSSDTNMPHHKARTYGLMPRPSKILSGHVQGTTSKAKEGSKTLAIEGSQTHYETKIPYDGGLENTGTGLIVTNPVSHDQHNGLAMPGPSNVTPPVDTNPINTFDDFFNLLEDGFIDPDMSLFASQIWDEPYDQNSTM